MADKDDDNAWPEQLCKRMKDGHEKHMREQETPTSRQHPDNDANMSPFILFKNFIDEGFNHLAQTFRDLSCNEPRENTASYDNPKEDNQPFDEVSWRESWSQSWTQYHQQSHQARKRWDGLVVRQYDQKALWGFIPSVEDNETEENELSEADKWAHMLLNEANARNAHVSPDKLHALFNDEEFPEQDCYRMLFTPGDFEPLKGVLRESERWDTRGSWLTFDWFEKNPYSPVKLETHPNLNAAGTKWRAAFEDLLNASLDKPMDCREQFGARPNGNTQSTLNGLGVDWVLSLMCRGVLPPSSNLLGSKLFFDLPGGRNGQPWPYWHPYGEQYRSLIKAIRTPALPPPENFDETHLYDDSYARATSPHENRSSAYEEWKRELEHNLSYYDGKLTAKANEPMELSYRDKLIARANEPMELSYRDKLIAGAKELAGETSDWAGKTTEQLEASVIGLQEQKWALGLRDAETQTPAHMPTETTNDAESTAKPSVLSSLTTTRTIRHPDGTVTKKITLKQSFSNGEQVTDEREHTYHDPVEGTTTQEKPDPEEGSSSWFWK